MSGQFDQTLAFLLRQLAGRPLEGMERSFKLTRHGLQAGRFLAGLGREILPAAEFVDICRALGMPPADLGDMTEFLPRATIFHFGFEEGGRDDQGERRGLFKVYLEFQKDLERARDSRDNGPRLLHLAYKWPVGANARAVVSRYVHFPGRSPAGVKEAVQAEYDEPAGMIAGRSQASAFRETAVALLDMAAGDVAVELMYLEVREQGTPRSSFDVRLYDSGLTLRDAGTVLVQCSRATGSDGSDVANLCANQADQPLGHVAGGKDRHGEPFLTIYYPVSGAEFG